MSQNQQTITLFFSTPVQFKLLQLHVMALSANKAKDAARWADKLGVDLSSTWNDESWFNHSFSVGNGHLSIIVDTSTREGLPLAPLAELFEAGVIIGAAVDVFYDQVGEHAAYFFLSNRYTTKDAFLEAIPEAASAVEDYEASDSSYDKFLDKPIPKMMAGLKAQQADAEAAVVVMREMAREFMLTKKSPETILRHMLVRAAFVRGLFHGVVFTMLTILLFKGFWFWLLLGIAVTVALPIFYVHQITSEDSSDDDADESADGQDEEALAQAK
ncbi:hypothetical protein [Permianibacter aggregans]|uniref:Uncharacterized protein n=1 Tax=Permianibacter aggregans TaxID=1510150 RepID=A0A4R6UQJ4_9GAMM|nr:hypothetical protein [Permianibacter aggregans]QGX38420.1 hypothetical protein E2H98_01560 [Permianibacter aggregans]TDQ45534.1 hypothetical protein EV696_1192 [Permianibacter aggregans]